MPARWLASQASRQGPENQPGASPTSQPTSQPDNQPAKRSANKSTTREPCKHGSLSLSLVILSLSLPPSPSAHRTYTGGRGWCGIRQASHHETARRPASHLAIQAGSLLNMGPDNQPTNQPKPVVSLAFSLSLPASESTRGRTFQTGYPAPHHMG